MNQILDEQKWWCSLVKGRNKHCVSSNTSAKHQKSRKGAEKKKRQQRNQQSRKSTSAERSIRHTHRQHIRKATRTVTEKLQKSKQQSQLRQHSSRRGTEKQQKLQQTCSKHNKHTNKPKRWFKRRQKRYLSFPFWQPTTSIIGCLVQWHDSRFGCERSRVQFDFVGEHTCLKGAFD